MFKIGDLVRLRLWDDLVNTYGEPDGDGDIFIPSSIDNGTYFDRAMRAYCGVEFCITDIDNENDNVFGLDIYEDGDRFSISLGMIELVPAHELQPYNTDEVDAFLTSIPVI